jgi:hypothetical protein
VKGRGTRRRAALAAALLVAAALSAVAPRALAAPVDDPLAAAARVDGWVVYAVPLAAGAGAPCCFTGWRKGRIEKRVCGLDRSGRDGIFGVVDRDDLRSRADQLVVHLRFEGGAVRQLLAVGDDCPVDPGRAVVRTLEGVTPAASVALLLRTAREAREDLADEALHALSLHDRVGTDALLAVARDPSQPRAARKQAFFWLGHSDDPRALAELEKVLTR